jgi:hypothetical protein
MKKKLDALWWSNQKNENKLMEQLKNKSRKIHDISAKVIHNDIYK